MLASNENFSVNVPRPGASVLFNIRQPYEKISDVSGVSFRSHDDRRPSKFIVLADDMKSAINKAWKHGGADFQSRFDKSTGQTQEMKEECCECCEAC